MPTVPSTSKLVKALRAGWANDNPNCFCQCGKVCPNADACIPVQGEIHQPYWTLREVRNQRGRMWAGCLFDPQQGKFVVTMLYGIAYETPCKAAEKVMVEALRSPNTPIRFDHNQFCTVDLAPVEEKIAQRLYDWGYNAFLDDREESDMRHPLQQAGWDAARQEAEAAIAEKDPGFVWIVSTAPALELAVPA
jgi:hypothetical protein